MTTSKLFRPARVVIAAFAVLAVVCVFVLLRRTPQTPVVPPKPTQVVEVPRHSLAEILHWIELKNRAVAELENGNFRNSISLFEQLAEECPENPLVATDLTIAYLLLLKATDIKGQDGVDAYHQTVAKAEAAAEQLLRIAGDETASHLLASKIAQVVPDEKRSIEQLNIAAKLAPEDAVVWYELFQAGRYSDDEDIKIRARLGLKRAYELWPDNLFVLREWLLQQSKQADPAITETLVNARALIEPLVEESPKLHGFNLLGEIDKAIAGIQDGSTNDRTQWNTTTRSIRLIANLLGPFHATQIDRQRIDREDVQDLRQLAFAKHEFSEAILATAPPLPKTLGPPVSVKLIPFPGVQQLPRLSNVRDVKWIDFDLDGRLDALVVRDSAVEVYGRGRADRAWERLAEYKSPKKLRGVVVGDLDRDFMSFTTTNEMDTFRTTDSDLAVYGPDGMLILENKRDETGENRVLRVVPGSADFERLSNVLAAATIDFDHDGDLDLVVSTDNGVSLWMNREQFSFTDVSDRSDLPPADLKATAIVPVDWNRNVEIDILLAGTSLGKAGYIDNIRHGRFRWQSLFTDHENVGDVASLSLADIDGNSSWDLFTCGETGITLTKTTSSSSGSVASLGSSNVCDKPTRGMTTWDYDNDGCLDIVAWGDEGLAIYHGESGGRFQPELHIVDHQPKRVDACAIGDVDGDGDSDLLVSGRDGLVIYANEGGNRNHWVDVLLRADANPEQFPDLRVNMLGIGSLIEVRVGPVCQRRMATSSPAHFGLGRYERIDSVRVVWTNGLACNEIDFEADQVLLKQQMMKGM